MFFLTDSKFFYPILSGITSLFSCLLEVTQIFGEKFIDHNCMLTLKNVLKHKLLRNCNLNKEIFVKEFFTYMECRIDLLNQYYFIIKNILFLNPTVKDYLNNLEIDKDCIQRISYLKKHFKHDYKLTAITLNLCFSVNLRLNIYNDDDQLIIDELMFKIFIDVLNHNTMDYPLEYGLSMPNQEILGDTNILCKNKKNISFMINIFPYIYRYFQKSFNDKIQQMAIECIYSLSFYDECHIIINKKENIDILTSISHEFNETRKTLNNLLWKLNRTKSIENNEKIIRNENINNLFINFHSQNKECVEKISQFLNDKNFFNIVIFDEKGK